MSYSSIVVAEVIVNTNYNRDNNVRLTKYII